MVTVSRTNNPGEINISALILRRCKYLLSRRSFPPKPFSTPPRERELKSTYYDQGLDRIDDTFILYRIIGNDLYPRHAKGQSRKNLSFILENESACTWCEKRWVVNRIVDDVEERKILELLEEHKQNYIHVPFDVKEYASRGWAWETFSGPDYFLTRRYKRLSPDMKLRALVQKYRHKSNYVTNVNGARNAALLQGKKLAKWVLPWDGNCFVTEPAWRDILSAVLARPYLKYFIVPMTRSQDSRRLLEPDFEAYPNQEPQIIFRFDAKETFNEEVPYGRRPKVELLWRLGVPGEWAFWEKDPWDLPFPAHSSEAGQFGFAGWVARLFSGNAELEENSKNSFIRRGPVRDNAVIAMLDRLDQEILARNVEING